MCDSRTDTKTGLLPVNEVRSLLDVCWKAKAITELMPALPKGLKPRYVHVIDAVWHINETNGQDTGTARVGDVSAFLAERGLDIRRIYVEEYHAHLSQLLGGLTSDQCETTVRTLTEALRLMQEDFQRRSQNI